jgi:DHA1 family multidrug resistance protein-like MFS transporter
MFLASGILSFAACIPALRLPARHGHAPDAGSARQRSSAGRLPRVKVDRSMLGALICAGVIGLTTGVYDICWTLLLVARGASGLAIGISWTLFAVPFVLAARPSGWLADHMDRRALVLAGLGVSTVLCASYPFIHNVPVLVLLGASEAMGFAAAMPAVQSLLTQGTRPSEVGRVQGSFATSQTACTAVSAAGAGAAFAVAIWLPFVTVAAAVTVALVAAAFTWRSVPGRVARSEDHSVPTLAETVSEPLRI